MSRYKIGYNEDAERLKRKYILQMPQRKCNIDYLSKLDHKIRFNYSIGFLWEEYEDKIGIELND